MSLINDALKRARQQTGGSPGNTKPPLPSIAPKDPADREKSILTGVIIFLVIAACFLIGLALAHHTVTKIVAESQLPDVAATQPAVAVSILPTNTSAASAADADVFSNLPKLQGIFYDPVYPAAIVDGKTVHVGDVAGSYRVKAISKFTITLANQQGAEKTVHMGE